MKKQNNIPIIKENMSKKEMDTLFQEILTQKDDMAYSSSTDDDSTKLEVAV